MERKSSACVFASVFELPGCSALALLVLPKPKLASFSGIRSLLAVAVLQPVNPLPPLSAASLDGL